MPTALPPLAVATGFAVGAVHAYRSSPLSVWGEAYAHVPMHLVTAAMSVLVAGGVLSLARRASTGRARRAAHRCTAAWVAVAAVFALEAAGATIGNGYGENSLHSAAVLLLVPAALLLAVASLLVVGTRGGAGPWPLRLVLLLSLPAVPSLTQASSPAALAVCLAAAAGWAALALTAVVPAAPPATAAAAV